ncbi:MAG: TPM domain-containing protein [Desulfobacterales bacterium]|jgi:putative membrane protein|nr:TPM domain-containing protein [Desulfobacterales bacterium]
MMKDLAEKFLSESDKRIIIEAVKTAEQKTSGEIVPLVVSASGSYPLANVTGGAALAFLPAVSLTPWIGGFFWIGGQNMWMFLILFIAFFLLFRETVKRLAWLKRLFISKKEIEEEVHEAAVTSFFKEGLYRTRDANGILIFISVLEHKVWVLADKGINTRVPQSRWTGIVDGIIEGIKENRQGAAICEAVMEVGGILSEHFPLKSDDTDELKNLIVKD